MIKFYKIPWLSENSYNYVKFYIIKVLAFTKFQKILRNSVLKYRSTVQLKELHKIGIS